MLDSPEMLKCRSDKWRQVAPNWSSITAANADKYCSYNMITLDAEGGPAGGNSAASMIVLCDKSGNDGSVTDTKFGGNHNKEGGHVALNAGAVRWVETQNWNTNSWGGADVASVVAY
jgi:hypothetical protein